MADKKYTLKDIPKGQKLSYIYDYYKYHIIISILAIVAFVSLVTGISNQEQYDTKILFTASNITTDNAVFDLLESEIAKMGVDVNGDSYSVPLVRNIIMFEDMTGFENAPESSMLMQALFAELTANECKIEIFDDSMYDMLLKNDVVATYESLNGELRGEGLIKIPYQETKLNDMVPMENFNKQLYVTIRPGDINNIEYYNQLMVFKKIISK